jgi:hypothetical protein
MILKANNFYTINFIHINLNVVIWIKEDKLFPLADDVYVSIPTDEQKQFWIDQMEVADRFTKNDFIAVNLRSFNEWKSKKKDLVKC